MRFSQLFLLGVSGLPFADGEYMIWNVSYMGVQAGKAWASVEKTEDVFVFSGGAQNAPWYAKIYTIDDEIESLWLNPGSSRYKTKFREGKFLQDQLMHISMNEVKVWRKQHFKEGWKEWEDTYEPPNEIVEDPQTALYRIRTFDLQPGDSYTFMVFSGKETWPLKASTKEIEQRETILGKLDVIPVDIYTKHKGDLEQKGALTVYFTYDDRRIPVFVVINANVGKIKAELVEYGVKQDEMED